jgi:phosphoserine aminotransferase
MTRSIDWTKVDMAYAHTQKNCGISGLTVMISNPKTVHPNPKAMIPEVCSW